MKHLRLFLLVVTTLLASVGAIAAQDGAPPGEMADDGPRPKRPNLFAELGLSPDQMEQIRRINQARRPQMLNAQRRLHEAGRSLDAAIYGELVSDSDFQTRLKEFHAAQAEVARLRFENEFAIRKVLSPEQLVKFRDLRRRFTEARGDGQERRRLRRGNTLPPPDGAPFRRPGND